MMVQCVEMLETTTPQLLSAYLNRTGMTFRLRVVSAAGREGIVEIAMLDLFGVGIETLDGILRLGEPFEIADPENIEWLDEITGDLDSR